MLAKERLKFPCRLLQYRMTKDYTDFKFIYPRTMDKLTIALIVMTLCKSPLGPPLNDKHKGWSAVPGRLCGYAHLLTSDPSMHLILSVTADWKAGKNLRINYPDADIVDRTVQFQSASNIGVGSPPCFMSPSDATIVATAEKGKKFCELVDSQELHCKSVG